MVHNLRTSFVRYEIGGEISINILLLTLDYFEENLITKFFKNPVIGSFWGLSAKCSNLGKNEFSWKKIAVGF